MHNLWFTAAAWTAVALVASLISIRVGISVALVEIVLGVLAGNFLQFQTSEWINFLASFGAILLTFLAGAEIDPVSLKTHWKAASAIGIVALLLPFLGASASSWSGRGHRRRDAIAARSRSSWRTPTRCSRSST